MNAPSEPLSPGDLFAQYEADLQQSRATGLITDQLRKSGLVTLSGLTSPQGITSLADRVMHWAAYEGAGPSGLHEVRDTGEHAHLAGQAELTRAAVDVHTRRADHVAPPRLVLMVCIDPGHAGGETVLVDGKALFADLCRHRPDTARAFLDQQAALFGRHEAALFAQAGYRHYALRLCQDGTVRWNAPAQPYLPVLRGALRRHQQILALRHGQGVLVDNARWATGRCAFTGPRLFLRAEGAARFRLPRGFFSEAVPT
ncbi:TauD/TfdA family dioxygenase [Streptomyces sp. NPDC037389]|uniref:TauD/TfdA family dioxygenase n=1 Tax=Streptomyces sp. NPDC037389 TaxID=3155369 RepID=UPI0033CBC84B